MLALTLLGCKRIQAGYPSGSEIRLGKQSFSRVQERIAEERKCDYIIQSFSRFPLQKPRDVARGSPCDSTREYSTDCLYLSWSQNSKLESFMLPNEEALLYKREDDRSSHTSASELEWAVENGIAWLEWWRPFDHHCDNRLTLHTSLQHLILGTSRRDWRQPIHTQATQCYLFGTKGNWSDFDDGTWTNTSPRILFGVLHKL